jgi:type IX secretion system PorP/SprF family membrane protein
MKSTGFRTVVISFFMLCHLSGQGQDVHFSQFNNSPLLVNPALAGEFQGNGRFMLNYRNQWSSITNNPYTTFASAYDRTFLRKILSAGVMAFTDKAGDAGMGITQVNLMLASRVDISETQYLKLGINGAWSQQSLNLSGLTWNSQFNGAIIDPNLYSGEEFLNEKFSYADFSTGVLWGCVFRNQSELRAGLAAYHITGPVFTDFSRVAQLPVRWCAYAGMAYPLPDKEVIIYPSLLAMIQGTNREFQAGGAARFMFDISSRYTGYYRASYLYLGAYYRYGDAVIAYARLDFKSQFNIGISYDINLSGLSAASNAGGGIEISLSLILPEKSSFKLQ